jgi:hypothetical protein
MSPYVRNSITGRRPGRRYCIGFLYFSDGTYTMSLQMLQMLTRCNVHLKMGNIVQAVPKTYPQCAAYGWGAAAACSRF